MEMSLKELKDSIREMQEVYDDKDTPDDIKNSIAPSLKKAKEMLLELTAAEKEKQVAEAAEVKAISKAKPKLKESTSVGERRSAQKDIVKKSVAKREAVKKVAKVKSKIEKELPALVALVAKTKALQGYRGKSEDELQADAKKKAMLPGKRISAKGKRYYEYRANRSDITPNKYPRLEQGGSLSGEEDYSINVFGYRTKYFYPAIGAEFENAIEILNKSKDYEGFYFRNTSEALEKMAAAMDHIYSAVELSKIQPVTKEDFSSAIDQALLAAIYNYRSGLHVNLSFIRDAIIDLYSTERKLARGGQIGEGEVKEYIYRHLRDKGIDETMFKRKIGQLRMDVLYGGVGEEDYEGFISTQNEVDDMLSAADIPDTLYYDDESGQVSDVEPGEPEYDDEGEMIQDFGQWYEINVKDVLYGNEAKYFGAGGRIKSAINRDRAYQSDEDWELRYDRKTKPKHPRYQKFAAGGTMPELIDDFPKGTEVYVDGNQFENALPRIKDDKLSAALKKAILPYIYEIGVVQDNTTHSATVKYGARKVLIPKIFLNRLVNFRKERIRQLKVVIQDFIPVLSDFNERFGFKKPDKILSVIRDLKKALLQEDTLYIEAKKALYKLYQFHEMPLDYESRDIYDGITEDFADELYVWAGDDHPARADWYVDTYNFSKEYVGSGKNSKDAIRNLKGHTKKSTAARKKLFGGIINIRTPDNLFNAHSGDGSIEF